MKILRKLFKKFNWPSIDVTRRSVEETAASIIKIHEISKKQMKIILASKSGVRKQILEKNKIICKVIPSNINEDEVKISLLANGATPTLVSIKKPGRA